MKVEVSYSVSMELLSRMKNKSIDIQQGQVWLCKPLMTGGSVESKTRPMIIISNNQSNRFSPNVNAIPITSARDEVRGVYQLQYYWKNSDTPQTILCEQITTIPKVNLLRYLYSLEPGILSEVKLAVRFQLSLND